jgi:NADPH-dependent curcumin reductase
VLIDAFSRGDNMSRPLNRRVLLKERPTGIPQAGHFELDESFVQPLQEGEVLVRNDWLSVEPAMRGWVSAVRNYAEPVEIGAVMRSFAAGTVVDSRDPSVREGARVTGLFGWQDYAVVRAKDIERIVTESDLPLSTALGVMGINGVTAHFGLLEIGRPVPGETVVVSTAAGSVGSCVGQIAKLHGCRTVGITGGARKMRLCEEAFGFDASVDYKAPDFESRLADACRGGVDVYFDNTAGPISDAVMSHLRPGARVVICGTSSISSWDPAPTGPRVERRLLVNRARMQGFVIFDHAQHYPAARHDLAQWLRAGSLRYREDVLEGLDKAPDAIAGLYRGENLGKRLIRVRPEAGPGDAPATRA